MLVQRVQELTGAASTLSPARWNQLQGRKEELDRWLDILNDLARDMQPEYRKVFVEQVEREVARPLRNLRDLLALRQVSENTDDPVLLLKGALLGDEMLNVASLDALLRRTRPGSMFRYFLPELNERLSYLGQKGMDAVYKALSPLSGEVELVIARPGEALDVKRHHIVKQDASGEQPNGKIVRCVALGLRDVESGVIEPKARVIIAG